MIAEDPAVQGWQAATESTMSTSSTARRLEAELEQARRGFNAELAARVDAEWKLDEALRRLSQALSACDELGKTHAVAILENNRLQRENTRLKEWEFAVAPDGGRPCERCGGEIRRGEAYEKRGADLIRHIYCPAKESR